jgi:hypothetical protein
MQMKNGVLCLLSYAGVTEAWDEDSIPAGLSKAPSEPAHSQAAAPPPIHVALRPDQPLSLAQALNVSVDDLVGTNGQKKRGNGPAGRMRQRFEVASKLRAASNKKSLPSWRPSSLTIVGRRIWVSLRA